MKLFKILGAIFSLLLILMPAAKAHAQDDGRNAEDSDLPAELIYETTDMENFNMLDTDLVNTHIEVVSGDHHGLQIFVSEKDLTLEEVFNVSVSNNALSIDEKDWKNNLSSLVRNLHSRIIVTVPDVSELTANIEYVNGEFRTSESLKELNLDIVNGDVILGGHITYPMEMDFVNADVELFFDEFDAEFNFEFVNGDIKILGDEISATFSEFRRTVGDGTHEIRIDAVNGSVVAAGRAR